MDNVHVIIKITRVKGAGYCIQADINSESGSPWTTWKRTASAADRQALQWKLLHEDKGALVHVEIWDGDTQVVPITE